MVITNFIKLLVYLRSQHGAFHGGVSPLDLGDVHEARAASDETSSREGQLGDALVSALIESSSTVTNSLASLNVMNVSRKPKQECSFFLLTSKRGATEGCVLNCWKVLKGCM